MVESICERIKKIRLEHNLSQREFGQLIGIKQNTMSRYEDGVIIPSVLVLQSISQKLNISICYFLTGEKPNLKLEKIPTKVLLRELSKRKDFSISFKMKGVD